MLESGSIGFATAFVAGRDLLPLALRAAAGARLPVLCRRHLAGGACATGRRAAASAGLSPSASCWASRRVFVAFGASATALGGLLLELALRAGHRRRRRSCSCSACTWRASCRIHLLEREARFHAEIPGGRVVGAFLLGLAFAFGWTPCIGPVLGVILTMSASSANLATGTALLAVYSLGLGLPFLLAALFTDVLLERLRQLGANRPAAAAGGRPPAGRGRAC